MQIITLIKESGAIEKSMALSDHYLDKALAILDELPTNRAKQTLQNIAKFIGKTEILNDLTTRILVAKFSKQ